MINPLLMLANQFEKVSLQVRTFANKPCKKNVFGIDFRQVDQKLQNLAKLVRQRFVFSNIDILKVIFRY